VESFWWKFVELDILWMFQDGKGIFGYFFLVVARFENGVVVFVWWSEDL
jgi:hypothetical protein